MGLTTRFCATSDVRDAFGMNDPCLLCRDLTTNLVRAFLYWMWANDNFQKLDAVLSHARHLRMAVKNEPQYNVPDAIAHDMSLVRYPLMLRNRPRSPVEQCINSELRVIFQLDELSRIKTSMNTDDFYGISVFNWTICEDWYPTNRDRKQHWLMDLLYFATAARPGTVIEGGGYRKENQSDSLKYKDLHLVRDPRNPNRKRLLMLIRLRLMKGYRNRGSP